MTDKELFITRLKKLRDDRGLSMTAFGAAVGINIRTIYRWFTECAPKPSSLIKIADFFDCSIDYLLGKTASPSFVPCTPRETFLSRYRGLRESKNLNDFRISRQCGISSGAIANWKKDTFPEFEILIKLGEIFECSIDYLVGRGLSL